MLDAGDGAATVLTGDQTALPINRVAILEAAICHEDRNRIVACVEAQQPVIRDVRKDQMPSSWEIGGAFGLACAGPQLLQLGVPEDQLAETRVQDDVRIFVNGKFTSARQPRDTPARVAAPDHRREPFFGEIVIRDKLLRLLGAVLTNGF